MMSAELPDSVAGEGHEPSRHSDVWLHRYLPSPAF